MKKYFCFSLIALIVTCAVHGQKKDMLIRLSEIEVDSASLHEYIKILKEESRASVQLEKGVIAISLCIRKIIRGR